MSFGRLEEHDTADLLAFVNACREWMLMYQVSGPESIHQVDRVQVGLYELGKLIGEWVGYPEYNEETDKLEYEE